MQKQYLKNCYGAPDIRTTLAMISVSGRVRDLFISHSTVFRTFTAYYISVVLLFLPVPALMFKPANKEDVLVLTTIPSKTEKHNREIEVVRFSFG